MVKIGGKQELLLSGEVSRRVGDVLACFRDELDDHRLAINENTEELASNMQAVNELNAKVDKLHERLDEIELLVKGSMRRKSFELKPLNAREKEVFHALYVLTESAPYATYDQIARKCAFTKDMVVLHISAMMRKGVMLVKRMNGNTVMLRLDEAFREEQAKRNLVGLSSLLQYL